MFLLKKIVAALILPPTGPALLALFGLWLARSASERDAKRWRRKAGMWLATLSLLTLIVLALPMTGTALMASLERHPPITGAQLARVQAIVILGGGTYHAGPEYGGDTVAYETLERVRYGARLARQARLPLLVSGGAARGVRAEGESMRDTLERDFGVKVRWIETRSRDTAGNARLSAALLKAEGISRIALVTHAWHLPRAIALFEKEGLEVTPAPTAFSTSSPSLAEAWLPGGSVKSRQALHEYLGRLYDSLLETAGGRIALGREPS